MQRRILHRFFCESFSSLVLRVFLVLPFGGVPAADQAFARDLVSNDSRLGKRTPTLSLLGTYGREESWRYREGSKGHLAIPLMDKAFVAEIPMIAKLLADLNFDLAAVDDDFARTTSPMVTAGNGKFFVANAETDVDSRARHIIPNRESFRRTAFERSSEWAAAISTERWPLPSCSPTSNWTAW